MGPVGPAPERLTPIEAELWNSVAGFPWIERSDAISLEILCTSYGDWRECCEIIQRDGMMIKVVKVHRSMVRGETGRTVTYRRHPLTRYKFALSALILHLAGKLWLTPLERAKRFRQPPEPNALVEFVRSKGKIDPPTP